MYHYTATYENRDIAEQAMRHFKIWAPELVWASTVQDTDGSATVFFSVDSVTDSFMDLWMPRASRA